MSNTINDLYLKYVDGEKDLEQDRYFNYLYQMIDAGEKEFSQQHQVLHKVVDERWLEAIEETLEPLFRIIEKPRRFIERVEEVVPVALAKKITADSVMHLSLNTQFIAKADEDEVQPTHILNVSLDESYDLYENRFIYHLIHRMVTFVDKRTDVIFWSTGDETQNTLKLESHVDDAYERIDYKVEMTVKNLQTFAENDADNIEVFKRIDRVRRMVLALRNSSFCEIMAGCQKVKSPIQRTNLLTKDPDYRACYNLWHFLEGYDEVGYSIEVQNSALEIDEEFVLQMYNNMIANYTIFKSITEGDSRNMDKIEPQRTRVIKPRFSKEIVEEIVDDYDIPDVEVRQVIVEEVTQAQLDAEAKLAEEIKNREGVEQALRDAEAGAHHSMIQAEYAMSAKNEAEEIAKEAEARYKEINEKLEQERETVDELRLQIQEKDAIIAEKDEQINTEVKDYVKQLEEQRIEYEYQLQQMSNEHELEIKEIFDDYKDKTEDFEMQYIDKMDQLEDKFMLELEAVQTRNEETLTKRIEEYEAQLLKQADDYNTKLEEDKLKYQSSVDKQMDEFQSSMRAQSERFEAELNQTKSSYEKKLSDKDALYSAEVDSIKANAVKELENQKKNSEAQLDMQKKSAQRKYDELVSKSDRDIRAIQAKTEREITNAKAEAQWSASKEQQNATRQIEEYKIKSDRLCAQMKQECEAEIAKIKRTAKEEYEYKTREAVAKAAELSAQVARLEKENAALAASEKSLRDALNKESSLRASAESNSIASKSLVNALELKNNAMSVAEFRQALRAEKKARKKINK